MGVRDETPGLPDQFASTDAAAAAYEQRCRDEDLIDAIAYGMHAFTADMRQKPRLWAREFDLGREVKP